MAGRSVVDQSIGFPEPPQSNPALAALLLESLHAIDAECQAMQYASMHYSVTKHVHAIRHSVAQMLAEIGGGPVS